MPKQVTIENFRGGLSLVNPKEIEDNQFQTLKNFFYNKDKRLQSRRGVKVFGTAIPDTVVLLNACDATTNFAVADDATTLATGAAIRGTNSVSFTLDVSNDAGNQATLTNASIGTVDISSAKGYLGFWFYVPAAFNTDLTAVKVRLGSDASNYYEWTLGTLTEAANNFVKLSYDDATETGTVNDASIDYFRLQVTYAASYTDKTGVLVDDIYSYSASSTAPVTSIFFHQRDDTLVRNLIAVAGTNMFHYNEGNTAWDVIKTGLTEFETGTGITTNRTRWDFAVYKNVFYMANGIDNYMDWNEVVVAEYAGQPKFRYLASISDRMFAAGDDSNPSTLYYDAAGQADAQTPNANSEVIGADQLGRINGLFEFGALILVGKSGRIFNFDVTGPSAPAIDAQNGWYSHRTIQNVGNAVIYLNDSGIDRLKQKGAATGAQALETESLTADLRSLMEQIEPFQYNANCGWYNKQLNNYYFSGDFNDDNIPERTIVMSSLGGLSNPWTEYTYSPFYDYGFYIDSSGDYHYLAASANGGTIFEIETGFDDNGAAIEHELRTKDFDFGRPNEVKEFQAVTIEGLKSPGQNISVQVFVDDTEVYDAEIDDTYLDTTATPTTVGSSPIGEQSIGGGSSPSPEDIDIFPYRIRLGGATFSAGQKISVKMISTGKSIVWTVDRMEIVYDGLPVDVFPAANFA